MSDSVDSRNSFGAERHDFEFIPYGCDPCAYVAQSILSTHTTLPDLSNVIVLMPSMIPAQRLRNALLDAAQTRGFVSLLGPHVYSLAQWATQQATQHAPVRQSYARQFMLLEALHGAENQFAHHNPWGLCVELIQLFDELTLNLVALPDDQHTFMQQLAHSYGIHDMTLRHLQQETQLVYQLWQAWHTQHQQENQLDVQQAYLQTIAQSLDHQTSDLQYYLLGFQQLCKAEWDWLLQFRQQNRVTTLFHGDEHFLRNAFPRLDNFCQTSTSDTLQSGQDQNEFSRFLTLVYQRHDASMQTRIHQAQTNIPQSPALERIQILPATGAEQEALAIDLQIRLWLQDGSQHIGIVSEDRRLARRLRALLERSGIMLRDVAGWALSTTSAAAVVERWLECIEEDFDIRALIDLLKSPFAFVEFPRETYLNSIYRFEHDVVHQQGVTRGIRHYKRQIQRCSKRQIAWPQSCAETIDSVFTRLQNAAAGLQKLADDRPHALQAYVHALQTSLDELGLSQPLQNDSAGHCLVEELATMMEQLSDRNLQLDWRTFRQWFGQIIENANFRPPLTPGPVTLYTLEQSHLFHFDALILGGADQTNLPGHPAPSIFFNNQVRKELGLTTHEQTMATRYYHFRRLLEAAPKTLITYCSDNEGNPNLPSPWIDVLERFHQLTYQQSLITSPIAAWADNLDTQVCIIDTQDLPAPQPYPSITVNTALLPSSISVSDHQSLIDCPFQFFAARCLALQPVEELRLLLKKADYGERVHHCLQAFHAQMKGHPTPFRLTFCAQNRAAAIEHLTHLSEFVFQLDIQDNIAHRGWLHRWMQLIPSYIDWQIQQAKTYQLASTEQKAEKALSDTLTLRGRIDRIDRSTTGTCVIDYKTGSTLPSKNDVLSGEKVQLSSYAILVEEVQQVAYLSLNKDKAKACDTLERPELDALLPDLEQRLIDVHQAIAQGQPMPAWGDTSTCQFCRFAGICRQQAWSENPSNH